MTSLHIGPCSYEAADFACKAWHYSGSMPAGRRVTFGVWWNRDYDGALVFSRGACRHIGRPWGLAQTEVAELARIALRQGHVTPTSRVVTIACRLLHRQSPGLRLLVSYSDPLQRHDGRGVYAAAGWVYLGVQQEERNIRLHGQEFHARTVFSRYGSRSVRWLREHIDPTAEAVPQPAKHKYVLGLDADMRAALNTVAQPYPKRPKEQAPVVHTGLGGATPTRPLHLIEATHV